MHSSKFPRRDRFGPRRLRLSALSGLLIVLLAATGAVFATTVRHLDLGRIVDASDVIVEGKVDAVRSYWRGKQIITEVAVTVGRGLKGPGAGRVTFVQIGGRVDSPVPLQMTVPGTPTLAAGDRGYFFLEPGDPGDRIIVGLFQGYVPVRHDGLGDFVMVEGKRRSPAEFDEEIRRHLAGQGPAGAGSPR